MQPDIDRAQNYDTESVDGILSVEKSSELDALQEIAANDALNFLDVKTPEDHFPLIAMATGIGKGRIIHKIIEKSVRSNPNAKILVIAGTKLNLVDQTQSALQGYLGEVDGSDHDWVDSESDDELNETTEDVSEEKLEQSFLYSTTDYKKRKESNSNVHVGTIQTIQSDSGRKNLNPDDYDLVIVDEAHNIGTQKRLDTIKQFKNVVGFTATPFRHTGVLKTPEQYGFTIINSLTLPEAQDREFLPPLIETPIPTDHLVDEIPTNLNGEIDYKKLEKLLKESPALRPFIADKIQEYIADGENGKKTIIAVNFVWEAEEIAKLLKEKGISVGVAVNQQAAKQIHSEEIPALDAIDRYKLPKENPNSLQVLISPYVASEGFDAPLTEVLVWASPTDSSVRYTQFTGRLARRAPGKQYGHVIDFLYQTAQYKWSYNFGQWMKDTVVQLPNGRLFQGSNKQLQQFSRIEGNGNPLSLPKVDIGLEDLLNSSGYLSPQVGEFVITQSFLLSVFRSDGTRLLEAARVIVEDMRKNRPELLVKRRSHTSVVTAVTDYSFFEERMQKIGFERRKPLLEVQADDFSITTTNLNSLFIGGTSKVMPLANEVVDELRSEFPDMVIERKSKRHIFPVVLDRELFVERMLAKGAEQKKQVPSVQQNEFLINQKSLSAKFKGKYKMVSAVAAEVLIELEGNNPELVQQRRSGPASVVIAITDGELFVQKMLARGLSLKLDISPPKEGEVVITQSVLNKLFVGHWNKTSVAANDVVNELKQTNPEALQERNIRGSSFVSIIDKDLFMIKMQEKGIKVR